MFDGSLASASIAIIGLGNVGRAISNNLLRAGYNLVAVMDKNPETLKHFPDNVVRAENATQLAQLSDVIVTALPLPSDVKAVMQAENGVFEGMSHLREMGENE